MCGESEERTEREHNFLHRFGDGELFLRENNRYHPLVLCDHPSGKQTQPAVFIFIFIFFRLSTLADYRGIPRN